MIPGDTMFRMVYRAIHTEGPKPTPLPNRTKTGVNEEKIIAAWENQKHRGSIDGLLPIAVYGEAENPSCGDVVKLDILPTDGIIVDARHSGRACVLCEAGAEMLCESLIGKSLAQVARLTPADMLALYEGTPIPVRLGCCLLPLKALKQCFE